MAEEEEEERGRELEGGRESAPNIVFERANSSRVGRSGGQEEGNVELLKKHKKREKTNSQNDKRNKKKHYPRKGKSQERNKHNKKQNAMQSNRNNRTHIEEAGRVAAAREGGRARGEAEKASGRFEASRGAACCDCGG
jgi:hypothetical protein